MASFSVFQLLVLVFSLAILSTTISAMERTEKMYKVVRNGPGCNSADQETLVCHVPVADEVNKSAVRERVFSNVVTDGAGEKVISVVMNKITDGIGGPGMEHVDV